MLRGGTGEVMKERNKVKVEKAVADKKVFKFLNKKPPCHEHWMAFYLFKSILIKGI